MPKLENWSIVQGSNNPYLAPELRTVSLVGEAYDREGFSDGTTIRTSSIQQLDIKGSIAVTRNTTYELGEPSKAFVEWLDEQGFELEDYQLD